jgi:hypothetical protein
MYSVGFDNPRHSGRSHLNRAVLSPVAISNDAEGRKTVKYQTFSPLYSFTPIAVETLGEIGDEAAAFFRILGKRITAVAGEPRSYQFMMQQLSVTIQRGNTACIVGTVQSSWDLDDIFSL